MNKLWILSSVFAVAIISVASAQNPFRNLEFGDTCEVTIEKLSTYSDIAYPTQRCQESIPNSWSTIEATVNDTSFIASLYFEDGYLRVVTLYFSDRLQEAKRLIFAKWGEPTACTADPGHPNIQSCWWEPINGIEVDVYIGFSTINLSIKDAEWLLEMYQQLAEESL